MRTDFTLDRYIIFHVCKRASWKSGHITSDNINHFFLATFQLPLTIFSLSTLSLFSLFFTCFPFLAHSKPFFPPLSLLCLNLLLSFSLLSCCTYNVHIIFFFFHYFPSESHIRSTLLCNLRILLVCPDSKFTYFEPRP